MRPCGRGRLPGPVASASVCRTDARQVLITILKYVTLIACPALHPCLATPNVDKLPGTGGRRAGLNRSRPGYGGDRVWPAILTAGALSLANLTLLALAAAGLARFLPTLARRAAARAPFWGAAAALGAALLALLVTALAQVALWAGAFVLCGEFSDFEEAFYHSAVNFTTLGYGDFVMSRRWRLLGPLEAVNGTLMLCLSAAVLFTVLGRVAEARAPRDGP